MLICIIMGPSFFLLALPICTTLRKNAWSMSLLYCIFYFFLLKSDPRARWRAGEDTAECHSGIMLAIISSHHMWCNAPWTRAHTFAVFPSIEMPPVSISMLHAATEKAHKLIGRKSKQINQSMSGGSAVMSNFPWTSLSRETKLLHVHACV